MINSKERTHLKRIKKLFCLMVATMMIVSMLPTTVFATTRQAVMVSNGGLEVEGYPNSALPIGNGYKLKTVKNEAGSINLLLSGPSSSSSPKYDDVTIYTISSTSSRDYITWNDLTISISDDSNNWLNEDEDDPSKDCTFNVVDADEDDTTSSSNNITMLSITKTRIKKNTQFEVTYQIVDYNIDANLVYSDLDAETTDDSELPYLTGFDSSGSFILQNSGVTFKPVKNHKSGKYAFEVTLPLKYTGSGKGLSFTLAYRNLAHTLRTIDCSTTVPRTEEYVEDDDDDDDDEESDIPVPYIIVDSYSYGGSSVTAGDEFTLKLKLRNTSTTNSLVNIVMNVSPMGVFSMASSSNTFYINQLQPGSMIEREVTLKAGLAKVTDDDDANSIDIKFTYQYAGSDANKLVSGSSSESITLPVDFPDRFELGAPEQDSEAYVGEDYYISVPMVNKGRSGVYNLTAYVRGDGLKNPGQTQYIGNLNAGTESSADFSLQYLEPGDYSGEIVVTYEDANMNPKELVSAFNVTVEDMGGDEPFEPEFPDGMNPDEPTEPANAEPEADPVRPVKIVVGLIVAAMSAYVTVQKAKAKRSIYLDEDL